jgi:glyoxylase-like metal-dependent hydrolase (beta-lactamase superfamily II)/rhodanese-related sulfurtransferase
MKVEQIYTGCLAQGAYYIVSEGVAAIIDPLRETKPYLERLERDKVSLAYIFETHFHADFVSGHVDLSKKTSAPIVYGPHANPEFEAIIATDGQEFRIGACTLTVLHTPGHTLESTTYLLKDEQGKEHCIFSGDTLFLGDVGRPDLAQKAASLSQEELAGMLYDSLNEKILPLPDDIIIYPAHGAGSACGKNMMKETVDTLGNQKRMNYALNQPNKEAFVHAVLDGLTPPPSYFGMNVAMNKKGYASFETVLNEGMRALTVEEFSDLIQSEHDLVVLDTRSSADFCKGFIPGSINIGINGDFAPWVGSMIGDVNQALVLIADAGKEEEVVTRLTRVGFDVLRGHLQGGFQAWKDAGRDVSTIHRISAEEFAKRVDVKKDNIIDVRKESEFETEHLENAVNKPLAYLNTWMNKLSGDEHYYLHCAGGYRSMVAASILQARSIRNITEVEGGFKAIAQTGLPVCSEVK